MNEWGKRIYRTILILVVAITVGLLSLVAVYSLPSEMNLNTVRKSVTLFENEGRYPHWAYGKVSLLDNFTDSIMLRNAIYPGSGSVVKDAILSPKLEYKNSNTIQSLIVQLKGEEREASVSYYPRYWHGYLIVLKPLTCFLDVSGIRLLNLFLQVLLTAYLLALLGTGLGKGFGISYLFAYLFLNPVSLAMSMQFSSVFYVMTLISIILLKWWNIFVKNKNYLYLFLLSGILTAYFDLLTYPLVTLGIPLTIFVIKYYYQELKIEDKRQAMSIIISTGLFWLIGYGGMYVGKWLLAWYVTDLSVVKETLNQLQYRMSSYLAANEGGRAITPVQAILENWFLVINEPIFTILMFILGFCLYKLYKIKKASINQNFTLLKYVLRIIMLYPFIWYALFSNHSFIHSFFTYRELSIFVFAEGCYITTCFMEKHNLK